MLYSIKWVFFILWKDNELHTKPKLKSCEHIYKLKRYICTGNTEESKIATTPLAIAAGSSSTPVVQQTCSPECAPTLGCTVDNDPSTCGGCLHARVKAGIVEFCVSSCKDVGSTVKEQRDGVDYCNGRIQVWLGSVWNSQNPNNMFNNYT